MSTNFIFANIFNVELSAPVTSTGQTTLTINSTTNAPTITAGQIWVIALNDAATQTVYEICYATARTGNVLTVLRGQEGTAATTWLAGDNVYAPDTAAILNNFALINGSSSQNFSVAGLTMTSTLTGGTTATFSGLISAGVAVSSAQSDLSASRTTTSGVLFLGSNGTTYLDFGVLNSGAFTLNGGNGLHVDGGGISAGSGTNVTTTTAGFVVGVKGAATNALAFSNTLSGTAYTLVGSGGATVNGVAGTLVQVQSEPSAAVLWTMDGSGNMGIEGTVYSSGAVVADGTLYCAGTGSVSSTGIVAGDIGSQRGASTGLYTSGGATSSGSWDWGVFNSGQWSARVNTGGAGYATINAAAFTVGSDEAFKSDIVPTKYGLKEIMALMPIDFTRTSDGGQDTGFKAQDVQMVMPRVVYTDNDKKMLLNYNSIFSALISAFQEYVKAHP